MTITDINILMADFIGLKSTNADVPVYTLNDSFKNFFSYKTTKELKFHESLDWLNVVIEKLTSIKDLTLAVQYYQNSCYVALMYKSQDIDGEFKNAKFSCVREKPINQYKRAIFEVIGNFLGWMKNLPDCESDIEYEIGYIAANQQGQNVVYMKPKEEKEEEEEEDKKV